MGVVLEGLAEYTVNNVNEVIGVYEHGISNR